MGQLSRNKHSQSGQRTILGLLAAFVLPTEVLVLGDPVAGSATAIKAATATVAAPVTLTKAAGDFTQAGLDALAAAPGGRKIVFTTGGGTAADAPANAVITGIDSNGNVATETLALAQTATTATSVTCWKDITSIAYPAADGTGATVAIGTTNVFGLPQKAFLRGGGIPRIFELQDGATPGTLGTLTTPAASAPNGGYAPNATPNGAIDYHMAYEIDASVLGI